MGYEAIRNLGGDILSAIKQEIGSEAFDSFVMNCAKEGVVRLGWSQLQEMEFTFSICSLEPKGGAKRFLVSMYHEGEGFSVIATRLGDTVKLHGFDRAEKFSPSSEVQGHA